VTVFVKLAVVDLRRIMAHTKVQIPVVVGGDIRKLWLSPVRMWKYFSETRGELILSGPRYIRPSSIIVKTPYGYATCTQPNERQKGVRLFMHSVHQVAFPGILVYVYATMPCGIRHEGVFKGAIHPGVRRSLMSTCKRKIGDEFL